MHVSFPCNIICKIEVSVMKVADKQPSVECTLSLPCVLSHTIRPLFSDNTQNQQLNDYQDVPASKIKGLAIPNTLVLANSLRSDDYI